MDLALNNCYGRGGGSNDNTTRKCVIRNILKENSTYINDSWEKPLLGLTQSWILPFLVTAPPRLYRRERSRYMSHEGESMCRGDTPTITYNGWCAIRPNQTPLPIIRYIFFFSSILLNDEWNMVVFVRTAFYSTLRALSDLWINITIDLMSSVRRLTVFILTFRLEKSQFSYIKHELSKSISLSGRYLQYTYYILCSGLILSK